MKDAILSIIIIDLIILHINYIKFYLYFLLTIFYIKKRLKIINIYILNR